MNLHLVRDEKFINHSFLTFEKYYPGQNIFLVQKQPLQTGFRYVETNQQMYGHGFSSRKDIEQLIRLAETQGVKHVLVHFLDPERARAAVALKKALDIKLYWIINGEDLYGPLNKMGKYPLFDRGTHLLPRTIKRLTRQTNLLLQGLRRFEMPYDYLSAFCQHLDYFATWNKYDYELLQQHVPNPSKLKEFRYFAHRGLDETEGFPPVQRDEPLTLIVNNSASYNGNHLTLFRLLGNLRGLEKVTRIYVPVSYGPSPNRKLILKKGIDHLGAGFTPLLDFLPKADYLQILNNITCGIYGSRRQEAAGNIYYLLGRGSKIFLRNENNVLQLCRDRGYHIFSVEDDLRSVDDLRALPPEQQRHNMALYKQQFSQAEVDRVMRGLFAED